MSIRNKLIPAVLLATLFISAEAKAPKNIILKSATDDSQFNLKDVKGKYVALHFLLKTECPYCLRHTHEYISNAESLPNVVQVFIKPDTEEAIKAWTNRLSDEDKNAIPIYRDPDAQLAKQFMIPDGYSFHNQSIHYPALILLGPDGKEVFRYVGKNNTDRYSFDKLTSKIKELSGKTE